MIDKILTGTVLSRRPDGYYRIDCPDAPPHLQTLHLRQSQMSGADVGDRVELQYQVTTRSGLWNVTKIIG